MPIVVSIAQPVLFEVFGLPIATFGFFMFLAFCTAYSILIRKSEEAQLTGADPADLIVCAILGGVFGAKLHCIISSDFRSFFSSTGFYFQGGVLGGAVCVILYLRYRKQDISKWADLILPLLPLGHGIGKLGCFFAGDGCYGKPSDLPWAMSFPNGLVPTRRPVHPTPLYECTVALILWQLASMKRWKVKGQRAGLVLMGLGGVRFFLESWNDHVHFILGLTQFQLAAIFIAFLGACVYPWRVRSSQSKKRI